eukprot:766413-Rhodomonas_salina.3
MGPSVSSGAGWSRNWLRSMTRGFAESGLSPHTRASAADLSAKLLRGSTPSLQETLVDTW